MYSYKKICYNISGKNYSAHLDYVSFDAMIWEDRFVGGYMTNCFYDNVKKNFGFGFMRLPMKGDEVDYEETTKMVDAFMDNGFNYFDTAHGYIGGKSEIALRECLVKRYPREDYILANKLTFNFFEKEEDILPCFEAQLEACGVEYFDFYLMHAQNAELFERYKRCRAYETAFELKAQGRVKNVGLSFHDKAEVLDQILTEYPQIDVVQIQFNYADYDDPGVESRKCYEVCVKHNKPIIVMEPVKGGNLVNLPDEAQAVFDALEGGSNASYALRFAASYEQVMMVLSGMSNMEQMEDNLSFMKDFQPLSEEEFAAVWKVCDIFKAQDLIPCTFCKYCVDGCPMNISIPDLFSDMNCLRRYVGWNGEWHYNMHTSGKGKASECIECGLCEEACPQHLSIRELLKQVATEFE